MEPSDNTVKKHGLLTDSCLMAMAGICYTVHTVQYTNRSGVFDI
jgi:hypothetical protein